jgi:hypothetical protein
MYKHKLMTLAAVLVLSVSGSAIGLAASPAPAFDELDQDANGLISRPEASGVPCVLRNFDAIQKANSNGLSPDEFAKAVSTHCTAGK